MSIWTYDSTIDDPAEIRDAMALGGCLFCATPLETFHDWSESGRPPGIGMRMLLETSEAGCVECCPACGWWRVGLRSTGAAGTYGMTETYSGAAGYLQKLDVTDQSVPIEAIRSYLMARYANRFDVDPWKFEEIVAAVYRDLGGRARATARSGDDGIDVVLERPGGELVGIQVKRYRNTIKVEQIRALAGALLLNGMTRGIFVTTSSFQAGAAKTADRYEALRGMRIELVDADRFYRDLGLAQRAAYSTGRDRKAPFRRDNVALTVLSRQTSRVEL